MDTTTLNRTPLYQLHIEHGAQMVPFAGYEMPVQYSAGVKKEHLHTRSRAGLFDISHMGQIKLHGENAAQILENLTPSLMHDLKPNAQRYTVLLNAQGGIVDDLMVTNTGEALFVVINAACKANDITHIQNHLSDDCRLEILDDYALLALQGPEASNIMQRYCPAANKLTFMSGDEFTLNNAPCFISRCGYSGEDGFEISVAADYAVDIAKLFLAEEAVQFIGLGARDSLRLEAGYCLYGHDLDENTTPVEANINWVVSKSRLEDTSQSYPGIEIIRKQSQQGTHRLRVGLLSDGKAPIRENVSILNEQEETVGIVSSGGYGPSVGKPVAMGYVNKAYTTSGTKLIVKIRDRIQHIKVIQLPFVEHRYYRRRT